MAGPDKVDIKVVRGKAAFHTLLPAAAFLIDQVASPAGKWIIAATALAMTVSVLAGPKWSLTGRLYRQVIAPAFRIAPGRPEAAAPHRFAETMGAIFLTAATASFLLGAATVGWALSLIVVALAALNWLGGICVGCRVYAIALRMSHRAGATG